MVVLGATSTVIAEGNLDEEPFELFASLSDDLARVVVRGSFGGRSVSLDATAEEPSAVRVVGEFSGTASPTGPNRQRPRALLVEGGHAGSRK